MCYGVWFTNFLVAESIIMIVHQTFVKKGEMPLAKLVNSSIGIPWLIQNLVFSDDANIHFLSQFEARKGLDNCGLFKFAY